MLVDDVRTSFAIQGKSIPPEIFRDLGDSDLADAKSSLVSVDVLAAVGSNRYADPITEAAGWRIQRSNKGEEFAYRFIGPAQNGLLIVVSRYNGGGSATFYMLHILDINAAKAFDAGGQVYDRVHVTTVQTIPLGDRWGGDVTLSGNAVRIKTTSAADGAGGNVRIVDVKRP
ncbi:MAG TPA: hypothetical protein VHY35_06995 [Stellaceae bacterium]|nr:hypothetical protein [Stellaceae bacterium]